MGLPQEGSSGSLKVPMMDCEYYESSHLQSLCLTQLLSFPRNSLMPNEDERCLVTQQQSIVFDILYELTFIRQCSHDNCFSEKIKAVNVADIPVIGKRKLRFSFV